MQMIEFKRRLQGCERKARGGEMAAAVVKVAERRCHSIAPSLKASQTLVKLGVSAITWWPADGAQARPATTRHVVRVAV
jgi:hypothetical protein